MSSNAFARSRPRVRHQRVPKTQCYAHPRFLQLVKELARIDDAKKKQEEPDTLDGVAMNANTRTSVASNVNCSSNGVCSHSTTTTSQQTVPHQHRHNNHHQHHDNQSSSPPLSAARLQQQSVIDCWPVNVSLSGSTCCNVVDEAHSSSSCRSLEFSQSASALNTNYYRQNNNDLAIANHGLQQNYHHHQRQYNYPSNHHQQAQSISNQLNNLSHSQPSYRCPMNKCPPIASSATVNPTNCCYSKSGLIDQSTVELTEPDHRQDENRTKRKRSTNDTSNNSKKPHPPTSPSSCSKRHKSSPEPDRPLSPSFTKCPICLLDCMDRDPSFTNTCFHLFCYVCIENWSKSKATCPLCRTKFTKIIYNIRSASCFDEKVASPIRRDDEDDRIIYEQLHGINANTIGPIRTSTTEETRLLFDNLRNSHNDVLMPHFALINQTINRHVSGVLQSFNSVTSNSNFNTSVPHTPFTTAANYNPVGSNYIALIPSDDRPQTLANGPAISSAYASNTSLANIGGESGNRLPRMSRSGRFIYSRNYDLTGIDGSTQRVSRSTNTDMNQNGISLEPRHHHHQLPHGTHHQQQHHGQHIQHPPQHRSSVATIQLGTSRQGQQINPHPHILPHLIAHRHYTSSHVYPRRPYTTSSPEQHILDNLYRQMPDM